MGPDYPGNRFAKNAFRQDGGEIIFHLPNGLQGYMLVDAKAQPHRCRPHRGRVSDSQKTSGTPTIVNGLSCIACHTQGIVNPPNDEVRSHSRFFNDARDQIERLYPTDKALSDKMEIDRKQFVDALDRVTGKILKTKGDSDTDTAYAEPVGAIGRDYQLKDLDLEAAAAELHEPNAKRLREKLENDDRLTELGLGVLLSKDGKIKRAFWESQLGGISVMQFTARALDYSPLHFN